MKLETKTVTKRDSISSNSFKSSTVTFLSKVLLLQTKLLLRFTIETNFTAVSYYPFVVLHTATSLKASTFPNE
jgi:hypothetical protein